MTGEKYDARAERWSEIAYADAATYLAHRGELVVNLGPPLEHGDTVLDLACGDAAAAEYLPGMRYVGLDASAEMIKAAKRRGRDVVLGDLNDYEPPEPVAATTCFRAIYYAKDRVAFLRRVARYTERKFVFDLNPRQFRVDDVGADVRAAGFDQLELRPFFSPQHFSLPQPVASVFYALERSGPVARLLLTMRFSYLCAAFRGGKNT
ncbi:MAG TPA: class I SAM-dependent methyltransferase [Gaiellaceae bacterium]